MKKLVLCLLAGIMIFAQVPAQDLNTDLGKDMMTLMSTLTEASPPLVLDDYVLFSFSSDDPVYLVGAAFSHESYRRIHSFSRNKFNVFVLLLPHPADVTEITYRLVVDGLWIHDPENKNTVKDQSGLRYSLVKIPEKMAEPLVSPLIENGNVYFTYSGTPARSVYLSGDFNNWNPYLYPMKEKNPGIYTLKLSLPPGTYFYCYFENGEKKLDNLNANAALNRDNQEANFFKFPPN